MSKKIETCKAPGARFFCDLVADARQERLPGVWSGSIYRHHPCGLIRRRFILCNEWNINNYCYASVMESPQLGTTTPSNNPATWGGDPHPHPKNGDEFFVYRNGKWCGEDGPWRNDLWTLISEIEVELAGKSLESEWNMAVKKCDDDRAKKILSNKRRAYYV